MELDDLSSPQALKLIDEIGMSSVQGSGDRFVIGRWVSHGEGYVNDARLDGGVFFETHPEVYQRLVERFGRGDPRIEQILWRANQAPIRQAIADGLPFDYSLARLAPERYAREPNALLLYADGQVDRALAVLGSGTVPARLREVELLLQAGTGPCLTTSRRPSICCPHSKDTTMKIKELRGDTLLSFVNSMSKERLHGEAFRAFLEDNLDLARWGFRLSHMAYDKKGGFTKVVYDSERCRVRFSLSNIGRGPEEDELHAMYGRLHALNENVVMVWGDEKCWCWHYSIPEPVLFLEGLSPREVVAHREREGDFPYPLPLAAQYESEQDRQLRNEYPPASVVWREALIWQTYGDRLFDLFDLRRPDLWEDYREFVRELHAEYDRVFPPRPVLGDQPLARDKIC